MTINELKDRAYEIACKHGWYEQEDSCAHNYMMIITELSEAVNADRMRKYAQRNMFEQNVLTPHTNPENHWNHCFEIFIKDSVEDELADAFIRFLSLAGKEGIELYDVYDEYYIRETVKKNLAEYLSSDLFSENMYLLVYKLVNRDRNFRFELFGLDILLISYALGIELFWFVEQKMKYNESRPYKHGKKY